MNNEQEYQFDLSGGTLCLDFANTRSSRHTSQPRERLNSYGDLITWSRQAGAIGDAEWRRLADAGRMRPAMAAAALERAVSLRETVFRVLAAVVAARRPESGDVGDLNAELESALARRRIVSGDQGFTWSWDEADDALDRPLWPVAVSAAELLTSEELPVLRECAAVDCDWLFLDTTRNRSRRWCDMKSCGNREKARRHYRRAKGTEQASG